VIYLVGQVARATDQAFLEEFQSLRHCPVPGKTYNNS
jgi:hypothetical protein